MKGLCRGRRLSQLLLILLLVYIVAILLLLVPLPSLRGPLSVERLVNIDRVIKEGLGQGPGPLAFLPSSCRPQRDVAFIKCMKCATETVGTVLRRYAYLHNLSVVLPVQKKIYLGWPFPLTSLDYRPSSHGYNLMVEHAIYNSSMMRQLMNPNTVFITIIREPLDLFVSTLNYFNVFELAAMPVKHGMKAVQVYLRDIEHYEGIYKSRQAAPKRYCIPDGFSITKNLLAHCLGMPLGFPSPRPDIIGDTSAVMRYIQQLDNDFLLVMVREYFEESLVLLRRLLCWDTKDIIYHSSNWGSYHANLSWAVLTEEDRLRHRHWSRVDYMLYEHFNATFWRKVHAQGPDFHREVAFFRSVQQQVTSFCRNITPYGESYIRFPESPWSLAFTFTAGDCRLMAAPLLQMLKERYDRQETRWANFSTDHVTRRFMPLC